MSSIPNWGRVLGVAATVGLGSVLSGCGGAGPPPTLYVLGAPPPETASIEPLTGRPVIEVKHVMVPDYLDVSDIMVRRSENKLAPSSSGRWGERLSVGVTRVLAYDLSRRLPDFVVTTNPVGAPASQVLVDIEDFSPRADGTVVLLARWRMLEGSGRTTIAGEQISLTNRATGADDAAIAAAMTRAVDDLATRIAAGVRNVSSRLRRSGQEHVRRR